MNENPTLTTELATVQAAMAAAARSVSYRWTAAQADVEGRPDVAALFRSIADAKLGHAIAMLGEFRAAPSSSLGLRLAVAAERDLAEQLERWAGEATDEGLEPAAALFTRQAAACRAQADRFAELAEV